MVVCRHLRTAEKRSPRLTVGSSKSLGTQFGGSAEQIHGAQRILPGRSRDGDGGISDDWTQGVSGGPLGEVVWAGGSRSADAEADRAVCVTGGGQQLGRRGGR